MKNNGEHSQKEFEKILTEKYGKKIFLERLPDTKSVMGQMRKAPVSQRSAVIVERPSDYIITLNGEMFYAEVKSCSDPVSFPFSNFEPGQWKAMKKQRAAAGIYFVFIHNLLTNQWFNVECREILDIEEQGKKSIKWTQMDQSPLLTK